MNVSENASNIMTSSKTGYVVAVGTTGAGTATWMEWITGNIGWIASTLGAVLTVILGIMNLQKVLSNQREKKRDDERYEREKREWALREELLREQIKQVREDD